MARCEEPELNFDDHQVSVFVTFPTNDRAARDSTFASLIRQPIADSESCSQFDRNSPRPVPVWLPHPLRPAVGGRYGNEPVFRPFEQADTGDLYMPIQKLLGGWTPERCSLYRLTQRALALLNKGESYEADVKAEDRHIYRLAIRFRDAPLRRLRQSLPEGAVIPGITLPIRNDTKPQVRLLPLKIIDCLVYQFGTGRTVCHLSLRFDPRLIPVVPGSLLGELADHVGRFGELVWLQTPGKLADIGADAGRIFPMEGLTVGSLVTRLVCGPCAVSQPSLRSFTHVFGRIDARGPATRRIELIRHAQLYARQYNSDYALTEDSEALHGEIVSDFENVVHVACREGAASLVDPRTFGEVVHKLENYRTNSLNAAYLPLVVLNIHQYAEALALNARGVLEYAGPEAPEMRGTSDPKAVVLVWEDMRDNLANLRNRFRFHQVSQVTMHHSWNAALRRALDLDFFEEMLERGASEMAVRLHAVSARLIAERSERFERQFGWISRIAGGLGIMVVVIELIALLNTFLKDGLNSFETASVGFLVVIAVVGLFGAFRQPKGKSGER